MSMPPILTATDLYRFFRAGEDETLALKGVSLRVEPGEMVAVVGPSGSGKSTLLNCLAGLDEPSGGSVSVAGARISHLPERVRARTRSEHIGVLRQSDNLVAHLNLVDNILLVQRRRPRGQRALVTELLNRLGLTERATAWPHELSGGELERAGLAVALANDPELLLADEPTGELDGATEGDVLQLIRARAESGSGVVVVTHSPIVTASADRVVTLSDGQIATEVAAA